MENQKKNQFRQIYDALPPRAVAAPKARWVERMAEVAMVSTKTVRCWLAGVQKPDAIKTKALSDELGIPADKLFV